MCTTLYIETLCKRPTSVAHLTNFSFEFFYKIFTEDASQPLLYHGAKKSKMTKNSNQGGSCLNNFSFLSFFLWSSALLSVLVLIFLLLSFSVQFLFRQVVLPHCRFKGYNAIKYLIPVNSLLSGSFLINSSLSAPTKIEKLTAGSDEKTQRSPAGNRTQDLANSSRTL